MASSNKGIGLQIGSAWFQRKINLRPQHRGVHLVTEEILRQMPEIGQFSVGLCHVQNDRLIYEDSKEADEVELLAKFEVLLNMLRRNYNCEARIINEALITIPDTQDCNKNMSDYFLHTSASLALNESWDPDVRDDMEMMLNKIVPEGLAYRHSCEGPDDMPAHVKACFLGSSLTIPMTEGKLNLGTWQGIWLCEHRDQAGSRKLVVTLNGCLRDSGRSPLSPVSPMASTSS